MAKFGLNMKIFILPQSDTNLIKDFLPAKYLPNKKNRSAQRVDRPDLLEIESCLLHDFDSLRVGFNDVESVCEVFK